MAEIRIRHPRKRGTFLNGSGWTSRSNRASRFTSVVDAIRYCAERDVSEADLLVDFRQRNAAVVVVPLPKLSFPKHWSTDEWAELGGAS